MKSKVAILTDTNSGISIHEAEELGIYLILMPILIDGKVYLEEKDISKDRFFELLEAGADIKTSQPSPGDIMDMFQKLLGEYEEVVYIPMTSGLSGTCQTATVLAEDFNGRVHVVDNLRISVPMRMSVYDAIALAKEGKSGAEIKAYLEADALNAPIFIMVDTLKYLKKGGRVTAAGAAIGEVLNIKPVLKIDGGKLDAFAKVRGSRQAVRVMLKAVEKERDTRLKDKKYMIAGAYSGDDATGEEVKAILEENFPGQKIIVNPLPLCICAHIGPGAFGMAVVAYYE